MTDPSNDDVRSLWNRIAEGWGEHVGDAGDYNRRLNSDPVLWRFAGDVAGRRVLDAGCGSGYLARQLTARGAQVVGVDLAPAMIDVARRRDAEGDYRTDSVAELATVADASQDLVIANYVLMDVPDLDAALGAIARVLVPGGELIAIFSHPCFPQGEAEIEDDEEEAVSYHWPFPYFSERRCVEPPWGPFDADFIWFHRPLSEYWKAFVAAGLQVVEFDEPHLGPEQPDFAVPRRILRNARLRPYSAAFKLRRS